MNEPQLDADRDEDRRLRAQIDPLIDGLSPLGKIELATRLMGEALLAPVRRRHAQPVITPTIVRVLEPAKKEGEREEAPERAAPPSLDGSASALPQSTSQE